MDKFFQFVNLLPMPLWLAMMFAPNQPITKKASRSSFVFIVVCLNYMLSLLNAMRGGDEKMTAVDFTSLDGIRRGLGTPEGALAGWTHMLALDLFTGAWIYRQCQQQAAPAWVRIPALAFTLMTGPFGLFLFLILRMIGSRQDETV
jgi:hypothetical protein